VFNDPDSAAATLGALRAEPHVVSAGIYTVGGTLFASYVRDGPPRTASVPRPPASLAAGHAFEGHRLVLFRPIQFDNSPIGTVLIESDLGEMTTRLQRYAAIVPGVLIVSFIVAYWTASRLQRLIAGPVLDLAHTAQKVSSHRDYSVRAVAHGGDELGLLVGTFNHMLDQIQERDTALQAARGQLELQVDERTRDLQREIADRKLLEEELRRKNAELQEQSRRVQEANRLKSEFLANMSHELRTPLNAILGFAELIHDGKVGPVLAEQKEYLGDILTSSHHLLQLINDVLDLSKVEAGKMEFRPERVNIGKLVGEVSDILRSIAAAKRIHKTVDIDANLGEVIIDAGKFKQVLYNYLSNALKFTPEEGRVTVRVRPEGTELFRLEIEDTGIGIKPEDLGRLFVEFQQLDASSSKAYPGTGLGLALTKRLVEAQGGQVGVRSELGNGSVFHAIFPRIAGASHSLKAAATPTIASSVVGPAVLIVEDDDRERDWLLATLTQAGYAVDTAATGAEAIARAHERRYDVITLDLLLPDSSGRDVLTVVRADGPNTETPVIVVTVVAETGIMSGFDIHDILTKPVSEQKLIASVSKAGVSKDASGPILVVDNDPSALKLAEATLSAAGYRCVCRGDGASALQAALDEAPAAVVLDLDMPGMDGFQILEELRRRSASQRIPVLVWTELDLPAEKRAKLLAKAQGLILKSAGPSTLIERLRFYVPPPRGSDTAGSR
jgi:signal transduction histidine kinase/DNA-binding response OmpR family regulator